MSDYSIELQEPDHDCASWRWRVTLLGNIVGSGMANDEEQARYFAELWMVAYSPSISDESLAW